MLLLLSTLALADIPPPPGYVEKCTIEKQCSADEDGAKCDAYYAGREDCEKLEAEGWTKKCQTRGASVWDEIFCRPKGSGATAASPEASTEEGKSPEPAPAAETKAPATPAPEPAAPATPVVEEEERRCSTVPGGLAGLWVVLVGAGMIRRRSSCEGSASC